VPALLPAEYVGDVHQRLSLYKKLAGTADDDALLQVQEELIDRYGRLPEPARALIETHRLRLDAQRLGIRRIDASADLIVLQFVPQPPIDTAKLIALVQKDRQVRLAGPEKLRIESKTPDLAARLARLRAVIKGLS